VRDAVAAKLFGQIVKNDRSCPRWCEDAAQSRLVARLTQLW
jgi:hypothetical protein